MWIGQRNPIFEKGERFMKVNTVVERLRHWLLILLSPIILGIITNLFVAWGTQQEISPWLWKISIGLGLLWIILYISAFTSVFRRPIEWIAAISRASHFKSPTILILDGSLVQRQPSTVPLLFTDRRPDDWQYALTCNNPGWKVETGPVQRLSEDRVDIVINPFGEAYPEEDLTIHTTLKRITDWVYQGGVYVNVAGYPFWWQHNPTTSVTTESGRWHIEVNQSANLTSATLKPILSDTLLGISPDMGMGEQQIDTQQQELDRRRFGEIAGIGGSSQVVTFRPYSISTQSMIPMLRTIDGQYIVIGAVPYGIGYFIFSGVKIDATSTAFEKVVAAVKGWSQYESRRRHVQ
jgi:hypothetical protein